ncbi:hypothetical protein F503_06457 [Ophiostoma piceae UAMH 11346]|uniref:Uncharacterized protein n=1 Tax=Ophiostoma piceae (strain UAMH 11346) TaxID=1262450 RepID=S3BWH9_OPHP1|nr:hypothetical protein F503_06457 [Ophiostoma piceae UAMH 11346]
MQPRARPIQRLATAVSQCSAEVCDGRMVWESESSRWAKPRARADKQAAVYGKCIVVDYNSVHKDKCVAEFMKLKNCCLTTWDRKPRGRAITAVGKRHVLTFLGCGKEGQMRTSDTFEESEVSSRCLASWSEQLLHLLPVGYCYGSLLAVTGGLVFVLHRVHESPPRGYHAKMRVPNMAVLWALREIMTSIAARHSTLWHIQLRPLRHHARP